MTSFISHTTEDATDAYRLSRWWQQVLDYDDDPEDPNEPALISYSSGTTALPKGALITHCVWRKAYGTAHLGQIQGAAQLLTVLASALPAAIAQKMHSVPIITRTVPRAGRGSFVPGKSLDRRACQAPITRATVSSRPPSSAARTA